MEGAEASGGLGGEALPRSVPIPQRATGGTPGCGSLIIPAERHVQIASEGALPGGLIAHGVSTELGIRSDGAGQFNILVHIACWIHAERPLTRMVPYSDEHGTAIEKAAADLGALSESQRIVWNRPKPNGRFWKHGSMSYA